MLKSQNNTVTCRVRAAAGTAASGAAADVVDVVVVLVLGVADVLQIQLCNISTASAYCAFP